MPASRSARAMIFAPRSWPSRPGFATTTRIFLSVEALMGRGSLERRRFGVAAEHSLERRDHLALGRLGSGSVEQMRRQVLALIASRPLESLERRGCGRLIAALTSCPDTRDLLLLELRVDSQDWEPLSIVAFGVCVDPHHLALTGLDLLLIAERRVCDLALRESPLDGFDHPAELVDPFEVVVRALLHPVGQGLD